MSDADNDDFGTVANKRQKVENGYHQQQEQQEEEKDPLIVLRRRQMMSRTENFRKKISSVINAHTKIEVSTGGTAAIKLLNLKLELCTIGVTAKKLSDPRLAMFMFDHMYGGVIGPTIQVEGRLTKKPVVDAFDRVEYSIEIEDVREQIILQEWGKQFQQQFRQTAIQKRWKFVGTEQELRRTRYNDIIVLQRPINQEQHHKYADRELFPDDMVDPDTGQVIECYAPQFRANLCVEKGQVQTKIMDENDLPLDPFAFDMGNKVRMAVRMSYGFCKYSTVCPTEYGLPRKILLLKRIDTFVPHKLNSIRWAEEEEDQDERNSIETVTNARTITAPVAAPNLSGHKRRRVDPEVMKSSLRFSANESILYYAFKEVDCIIFVMNGVIDLIISYAQFLLPIFALSPIKTDMWPNAPPFDKNCPSVLGSTVSCFNPAQPRKRVPGIVAVVPQITPTSTQRWLGLIFPVPYCHSNGTYKLGADRTNLTDKSLVDIAPKDGVYVVHYVNVLAKEQVYVDRQHPPTTLTQKIAQSYPSLKLDDRNFMHRSPAYASNCEHLFDHSSRETYQSVTLFPDEIQPHLLEQIILDKYTS